MPLKPRSPSEQYGCQTPEIPSLLQRATKLVVKTEYFPKIALLLSHSLGPRPEFLYVASLCIPSILSRTCHEPVHEKCIAVA